MLRVELAQQLEESSSAQVKAENLLREKSQLQEEIQILRTEHGELKVPPAFHGMPNVYIYCCGCYLLSRLRYAIWRMIICQD